MGVFDYVRYEANCPHCGKRLTAFQPWGCPYCGRRFRHAEDAIVHSDRCRRSPANAPAEARCKASPPAGCSQGVPDGNG